MIYTYHGILLNYKKKRSFDIWYDIDEPWKHCIKWNKLDTWRSTVYSLLYEMYRIEQKWEKKINYWLPGIGNKGEWCYYLMIKGILFRVRKTSGNK